MARKNRITALRTTRANLNAQGGLSNLNIGEPYLITDESRVAIGVSSTAYEAMAKQSELGGITPASNVQLTKIGSATEYNLQRVHDVTRSAGHISGGVITDVGGGSISVSSGQGFIRSVSDDTSTLFAFDWPAIVSAAVAVNTVQYVYVNYNSGTPSVVLSASEVYNYQTSFPVGFVVNEGGTLYINDTPHNVGRSIGRILRRNAEVEGRSRANALGGLILSSVGDKKVAVTAGVTWFRGTRDTFPGINTDVASTFDTYYRDGSSGWTKATGVTTLPYGLWDDGSGTLRSPGDRDYFNYWFYLGPSSQIIMVYGRESFNNLAQVLDATPPSDLPLRLQVGSLLLGRIIIYRNGSIGSASSYSVATVQTAFGTSYSGTAASSHNNLGGLQGGTSDEYFHITSAQLDVLAVTSGINTGDQTSVTGNAGSATVLATGRTISATGDATGVTGSFNGSSNASMALTLATVNANVGTFGSALVVPSITVNAKGLVTSVASIGIPSAIASGASGLMTGTDKAKLDGITANAKPNAQVFTFGGTGVPTTGTDKTPWIRVMSSGLTCVSAALVAKTAPSGGSFVVSILRSANGGSTFTTTVSTLTLTTGNTVVTGVPTTALAVGDLLRLDITSVNGAADWSVELRASE